MAEKRETVWAVFTNSDLTEGRGREYVKHFCRLKATALRLAKRGYVQGSDCPVKPMEVLNLDGQRVLPMSVIRVEEPTKDDEAHELSLQRREAAIQKAKEAGLSPEEIALIAGGAA